MKGLLKESSGEHSDGSAVGTAHLQLSSGALIDVVGTLTGVVGEV